MSSDFRPEDIKGAEAALYEHVCDLVAQARALCEEGDTSYASCLLYNAELALKRWAEARAALERLGVAASTSHDERLGEVLSSTPSSGPTCPKGAAVAHRARSGKP